MSRQLVLIHGRAQEHKDAAALKAEWLDALDEGLAKSGLKLPIADTDVRFPFYGDTLYDLVAGKPKDSAAEVIVRGEESSTEEKEFAQAILRQVQEKAGISDEQVMEVLAQDVVEKGPLNWGWVQGILSAIDRHVPYGSGSSIALFTHDVYQYLKNGTIRKQIDTGVAAALTPGVETIVVSHSLGTVVAYNLLRREGKQRGWKVPLLVTLGSPLGVTEIRKAVRDAAPPMRCPDCVSKWFNAMDDRDVVALYALTPAHFPLDPTEPSVENKQDVKNKTRNRHGIAGYLDDAEVAKRIHAALVA